MISSGAPDMLIKLHPSKLLFDPSQNEEVNVTSLFLLVVSHCIDRLTASATSANRNDMSWLTFSKWIAERERVDCQIKIRSTTKFVILSDFIATRTWGKSVHWRVLFMRFDTMYVPYWVELIWIFNRSAPDWPADKPCSNSLNCRFNKSPTKSRISSISWLK